MINPHPYGTKEFDDWWDGFFKMEKLKELVRNLRTHIFYQDVYLNRHEARPEVKENAREHLNTENRKKWDLETEELIKKACE